MKEIQIGVAVGDVLLVWQAGHRIFGREAGNVVSRLNRLANGVRPEIGGGGIAATLPQVNRHAQRLVPVALHVFELALANRHTQSGTFRHLHPGITGTQLSGMGQGQVGQRLELLGVILKSGFRGGEGPGLGRGGARRG